MALYTRAYVARLNEKSVKKYTHRTHLLSRRCETPTAENGPAPRTWKDKVHRLLSLYRYDTRSEARCSAKRCLLFSICGPRCQGSRMRLCLASIAAKFASRIRRRDRAGRRRLVTPASRRLSRQPGIAAGGLRGKRIKAPAGAFLEFRPGESRFPPSGGGWMAGIIFQI